MSEIPEDVKSAEVAIKARLQAQADAALVDPLRPARWAQFDDMFGNVVSSGYELPAIRQSHPITDKEQT